MRQKTIKVPFEVILRNKKTKEEVKVDDISVPVKVSVNKEKLHKIMKENVRKEGTDEN